MDVEVYKALADENRLRILNIIAERELCVCEIEEVLGITQSNASRHLNKLRQAGLVSSRKEAQWTYYAFDPCFGSGSSYLFRHLISTFALDTALREERRRAASIPDKCDRRTFPLDLAQIQTGQEEQE